MDFSEQYIKMCKNASSVQEAWQPAVGDFALWDASIEEPSPVLIYNVDDDLLHVVTLQRGTYHVLTKDDLIWLPRQDQLLELCHQEYEIVPKPFLAWECIAPALFLDAYRRFETYEQLWLVLLMWLRHNQVWDGEQWTHY